MSFADAEQRPAKKRRFFVEQSPVAERSLGIEHGFQDRSESLLDTSLTISPVDDSTYPISASYDHGKSSKVAVENHDRVNETTSQEDGTFDGNLFESVVGERLDPEGTRRIREMAGDNMERGSYCGGSNN